MHRSIREGCSWNWHSFLLIGLVFSMAALALVEPGRELSRDPEVGPAPAFRAPTEGGRVDLRAPGLAGMPAREQASVALGREEAISDALGVNRILARADSRAPSAYRDERPAKDEILFALEEPEEAARVAVIPRVARLAPGEAVEVLSAVFATETDVLVRSRAIAALTRLRGPGATALLRSRALDDADASLRAQALNALAATKGERSATVFGRALRLDADPEVRLTAIRALQRVGGKWARGYLERATADPDLRISAAAEQALATWPEPLD